MSNENKESHKVTMALAASTLCAAAEMSTDISTPPLRSERMECTPRRFSSRVRRRKGRKTRSFVTWKAGMFLADDYVGERGYVP
jgi:hypothetical protein